MKSTNLLSLKKKIASACAALILSGALAAVSSAQPAANAPATALSPAELEDLLGGPTLVSLHLKDAPPEEVFRQIEQQTGVAIHLGRTNLQDWKGKKVSLVLERKPFWRALQEVSRQLPFWISRRGNNPAFVVSASNQPLAEMQGPSFQSGPFLFFANKIARNQWLSRPLGETATSATETMRWGIPVELYPRPQVEEGDIVRLTISALPDPKVRILASSATFEVAPAISDTNQLVLPLANENGGLTFGYFATAIWKLQSDLLAYNSQPYRSIRFKGAVKAQAITKSETWEIPDILQAKEVAKTVATPAGKIRYILHSVETKDAEYRVHLTVERPAFEWEKLSPLEQRRKEGESHRIFDSIRLVDNQHRDLSFNGGGGGSAGPSSAYELRFSRRWSDDGNDDVGAPEKLILEIPTEIRDVTIPVEFKELPIPYFPRAKY